MPPGRTASQAPGSDTVLPAPCDVGCWLRVRWQNTRDYWSFITPSSRSTARIPFLSPNTMPSFLWAVPEGQAIAVVATALRRDPTSVEELLLGGGHARPGLSFSGKMWGTGAGGVVPREEQACGPLCVRLAMAREASGFAGPDERQPLGSHLRPGMQGAQISVLCPGGMMRGDRGQCAVGSLLSCNIVSTQTPVYSHEPGTQRHVVACP